jgi:hypothetical protein
VTTTLTPLLAVAHPLAENKSNLHDKVGDIGSCDIRLKLCGEQNGVCGNARESKEKNALNERYECNVEDEEDKLGNVFL